MQHNPVNNILLLIIFFLQNISNFSYAHPQYSHLSTGLQVVNSHFCIILLNYQREKVIKNHLYKYPPQILFI